MQSSEALEAGMEEQRILHSDCSLPSLVLSQSGYLVLLAHWLGFQV